MPLVHVLVINWNGLEHLKACFDALLACTYANVRFVLVDNASEDDSAAFVRSQYGHDARVEILECPSNLGWSGGNNAGLRRAIDAGADYAFLLNNDTASAPDFLEPAVAAAEADPAIGVVASKMLLFDQPHLINSTGLECTHIGSSWDIGAGRLDGPRWNEAGPVLGACGGACLVRLSALEKTGLLPKEFGIYLDDLDLCLRMWNAGYRIVYCPESVVRHKFSATLGQGSRAHYKYFLNTRNRFRLLLRHFPLSKLLRHAPALFWGEVRAVGRGMLDGDFWKIPAHGKAWLSAAGYLPRALAERRRRRIAGQDACRFWSFIRTDRMFCPGVLLPENGWYPEITWKGRRLCPMSAVAEAQWHGGRLRVVYGACYPHLGAVEIAVASEGGEERILRTQDIAEDEWDAPPGRLTFTARRIFEAEATGERMDLGGWVHLDEG